MRRPKRSVLGSASAPAKLKSVNSQPPRSDFTAIGGTVNLTARLESQAAAGEILISAESAALAPDLMVGTPTRTLVLKGIEHPVLAHVLTPTADRPFAPIAKGFRG